MIKKIFFIIFIIFIVFILFFENLTYRYLVKCDLCDAKSYYSQEQQKLVKIICDSNLGGWKSEAKILECWKNEAQILKVSEMCKDDVDCWKLVNVIINL